ncbi:MAG: hypothetical protein APG08_00740 [Candidatus Methanofastidiosum methylothiophilum]|uniref:Uncharacterized protein n=1 Tax=Candidatus Methanofastidiosum methylothiophilum TaxID=1705564 RepID=A0A150JEU2_9EURY|nr:MAG: hypothetical protein APG09_01560 [Candidatus Methanofastidiosum methylthiophilus]KYC56783.1 MAG: hypothetical protein APG08_00740 [Candidatus Methanofastidiosum methylthiophilus]
MLPIFVIRIFIFISIQNVIPNKYFFIIIINIALSRLREVSLLERGHTIKINIQLAIH